MNDARVQSKIADGEGARLPVGRAEPERPPRLVREPRRGGAGEATERRTVARDAAWAKEPARERLPDEAREGRAPAQQAEPQPVAADHDGDKPRRGLLRRPLALLSGAILLAAALAGGYVWWDYASHFESTDDAFIESRQFAVQPKVSGYLVSVPVTDNQHVAAADVIARIDDRDYRVAVDQAQGQVDAAQASIANVDAQLGVQQAQVAQAEAQVEQAQASLVFAKQQAARYQELVRRDAGTVQNAQQYTSQLYQQEAALKTAQAAQVAAQRQIVSLKAQRSTAQANLAQAEAQRDQAKLNLSYTVVTAAQPGRVVSLSAAVGQFVQPGTNLSMFVPDELWVTANFKETQLSAMRPGQPVTLRIDAYPGYLVRGSVASVQPGSGTAFSLLPAQNATGNYVKIVQRVPVKIVIDNAPADVALGPGMSVEPTVKIDAAPSVYERLASRYARLPTLAALLDWKARAAPGGQG